MSLRPLILLGICLAAAACNGDDDNGTGTPLSNATPFGDDTTSSPGGTDDTGGDEPSATATTADDPTSTTAAASSGDEPDATSDDPTTPPSTETTATTDASTSEPAPTDGPGLLPGETGLEAFCRRYVECGGTYYADAQECMDASLGYWGECPSRRAALDDFGACMCEMECSDWNPDAYNPGSTPCAQEWQDLGASDPC